MPGCPISPTIPCDERSFRVQSAADLDHEDLSFEEVEPRLRERWERGETEGDARRGTAGLTWEEMREIARDGWERIRRGDEEQSL